MLGDLNIVLAVVDYADCDSDGDGNATIVVIVGHPHTALSTNGSVSWTDEYMPVAKSDVCRPSAQDTWPVSTVLVTQEWQRRRWVTDGGLGGITRKYCTRMGLERSIRIPIWRVKTVSL